MEKHYKSITLNVDNEFNLKYGDCANFSTAAYNIYDKLLTLANLHGLF